MTLQNQGLRADEKHILTCMAKIILQTAVVKPLTKVSAECFYMNISVLYSLVTRALYLNNYQGEALIGESLGLVSVSKQKVLRLLVSSRSSTKFWRLSRLGLVSFASILLSLVSVSSWSGFVVFKYNKAKIQSFSSLKDGSRFGLVEKDT